MYKANANDKKAGRVVLIANNTEFRPQRIK